MAAKTPRQTLWSIYRDEVRLPAALLMRDATLTLIALAALALVLIASRGFSALGAPEWFTKKLDTVDHLLAFVDLLILGLDTTGKLLVAALRGNRT